MMSGSFCNLLYFNAILQDIDAMFAFIWTRLRSMSLLTPQEYKAMLEDIFHESKIDFKCVDLFAVPDYTGYFDGHLRGHTRNFKEGLTQLQWIFTSVPKTTQHPLGVKSEYRAFAQDSVVEIKKTTEFDFVKVPNLKLVPMNSTVTIHETPNVLRSAPKGVPTVEKFAIGARAKLEEIIAKVRKELPGSEGQWEAFAKMFPQSDDAKEFVQTNGLHIPLRRVLFQSWAPIGAPTRRLTKASMNLYHGIVSDLLQAQCSNSVSLLSEKPRAPRVLLPDKRLKSTELLVVSRKRKMPSEEVSRKRQVPSDDTNHRKTRRVSKKKYVNIADLKVTLHGSGLSTAGSRKELLERVREMGTK